MYKYEKRGKRNYTVKHVKTKAEAEEEKVAERMKHHKEVFPFMRMTNVIRQKDGTIALLERSGTTLAAVHCGSRA